MVLVFCFLGSRGFPAPFPFYNIFSFFIITITVQDLRFYFIFNQIAVLGFSFPSSMNRSLKIDLIINHVSMFIIIIIIMNVVNANIYNLK